MSFLTTHRRAAAGALILILPLAALAGCGEGKKRTVKAEFQAAQDNIGSSKAATFTLSIKDSQDSLRTLMTTGEDPAAASTADALLGGSVSYTIDPVGAKTLGSYQPAANEDIATQLKTVNAAISINAAKGPLVQLRLVDGVLYAQISYDQIKSLAEAEGTKDFDSSLEEFGSTEPKFKALIADVKAGKWVKLDLSAFIDDFKALTEMFTPPTAPTTPTPTATLDSEQLGKTIFDALKPHVVVKDANSDSKNRVLDVTVSVRPALKAVLHLLQTTPGLPAGVEIFQEIDPADIDKNVKEGLAKGTITLADGHLKQVAIDVESIRVLSTDAGTDSLAGTLVVLDVDDDADEVTAPTDVSSVDIGQLIEDLIASFTGIETA